jgi:hypothetical protein
MIDCGFGSGYGNGNMNYARSSIDTGYLMNVLQGLRIYDIASEIISTNLLSISSCCEFSNIVLNQLRTSEIEGRIQ